jgi:hypothetical protein
METVISLFLLSLCAVCAVFAVGGGRRRARAVAPARVRQGGKFRVE